MLKKRMAGKKVRKRKKKSLRATEGKYSSATQSDDYNTPKVMTARQRGQMSPGESGGQ